MSEPSLDDLDYEAIAIRMNKVKTATFSDKVYTAEDARELAYGLTSVYKILLGKELPIEEIPKSLENLVGEETREHLAKILRKANV